MSNPRWYGIFKSEPAVLRWLWTKSIWRIYFPKRHSNLKLVYYWSSQFFLTECFSTDCNRCAGPWTCTECERGFALYKSPYMGSTVCLRRCVRGYVKRNVYGVMKCVRRGTVIKTTTTTPTTTPTTTTTEEFTTKDTTTKATKTSTATSATDKTIKSTEKTATTTAKAATTTTTTTSN